MSGNKKYDSGRKNYANGPTNGHSGGTVKGKPRNRAITMEGVYGNPRFSYGVTSLIGCPVQVEVKNGGLYEGIFLTFSPKMEIVLQMAHQLDGNQEGPLHKDEVIDAIIFKAQDVVTIVATNVDLDYASKDTFTDSAISKFNGEVIGRELERWDADGPGADLSLESDVNGWGVEDMFKTNAEKYNVKSSYDANLSAYTTTLEVDDSAEGQAKQARAAKLAREIEQSDTYRQQVELENQDEDENISAVIRESTSPRDQSATGRYVPPHLRKSGGGWPRSAVNTKPVNINGAALNADGASALQPVVSSPNTNSRTPEIIDVPVQSELDKNKKNVMMNSKPDIVPKQTTNVPVTSQRSLPSSPTMPQSSNSIVTAASLGSKQDPSATSVNTHRPLQHSKSEHSRLDEQSDTASHHARSLRQQKAEHKKPGRDDNKVIISELKDFSDNFNLSTDVDKDKRPEPKTQRQSSQTSESQTHNDEKPPTPQKTESVKETTTEEIPEKKKFTLNPNAKEFTLNPNAREFKPTTVPVMQSATSPRPHTQSPVIQQAIPINQAMYAPAPAYMATPIPPAMMPPPGDQQAKRAVVSVLTPSAQALAATGTPLQAQPAAGMPGTPQYPAFHPSLVVQPAQNMSHYTHSQGQMYSQQMVPIPNNGPRLVNAQQMGAQMTQMAQYPHHPHHHHHHQQMGQLATMNVAQQQMFIQGPGGMSQAQPQMMPPNQPPNHHHHPPHYVPHQSRSTPPQQTSHPPPQQQQPPQPQPPQTQPTAQAAQHPSQQQISYHPNGQVQPGSQPPLQPSPHTPASPQAQPPVIPMSYAFSQPPVQTHTQNPAMHQMAANYMQVTPQVTYTTHHAHGPPPQNVMMIQQPTQHIQGQPHHIQHAPQMPANQMQGHVHMSQSGHPMGGPQMGPMPAGQLHYAPQPSPR